MRNIILINLFLVLIVSTVSCQSTGDEHQGDLLFNSGFEKESKVVHQSSKPSTDDDIIGQDLSVKGPNNWVMDIDKSTNLGNFSLQYQGGDTTMRYARIKPEPGNPDNNVLHFWINQANVGNGKKARIQANIYAGRDDEMKGIKELYQSVRIFLPEDMEVIKNYPDKISWLTIFEVWNNIQWIDDPYPFRITAGIGKPTADTNDLYFMVGAEDYQYPSENNRGQYLEIWHEMNTEVSVPIGKWITLEYYIKEGNNQSGRFYMLMTPEGGEREVIFDIQNFTHNTNDPHPDGIKLWNPMKLYTSRELVDYVRGQGKALQLFWDDFSIWKERLP